MGAHFGRDGQRPGDALSREENRMPFLSKLTWLWRNLARKPRVEKDLDDELRAYRQMLVDEKTRAGIDPRRAHREALIEMGGAEQIKEEVRDVRLGASLESIGSELRQSLRSLRRNPGLTVLGVLMLGTRNRGEHRSCSAFSTRRSSVLCHFAIWSDWSRSGKPGSTAASTRHRSPRQTSGTSAL